MAHLRDTSELIFAGRVFAVRRHQAVEPGGIHVTRELVHHGGSAVILPMFADSKILLIRQFRLAVRRAIWELPAGTIDKPEKPLQTAQRELAEETGYASRSWRKLVEFYPSPGITDEKMTLFLARNIRPGAPHMEADERITTRVFSRTEALRLVRENKIIDGKTILGLLYMDRWKNGW